MPLPNKTLSAKDYYDRFAEDYFAHKSDKAGSPFHTYYEKPAMFEILPNLTGRAVLTIGCGSAEECKELKDRGANRVVGTDISEKLIEIAKKQVPGCEFQVMDMQTLDFAPNSFDLVYSSLALHYAKDWAAVMQGVSRILKPDGIFLFSTGHPFLEAFAWRHEADGTKSYREFIIEKNRETEEVTSTSDYLADRVFPMKLFGHADEYYAETLHLSLGSMFRVILDAGFQLVNFVEPKPTEEFETVDPMNYAMLMKIPAFVIFKLQKPE